MKATRDNNTTSLAILRHTAGHLVPQFFQQIFPRKPSLTGLLKYSDLKVSAISPKLCREYSFLACSKPYACIFLLHSCQDESFVERQTESHSSPVPSEDKGMRDNINQPVARPGQNFFGGRSNILTLSEQQHFVWNTDSRSTKWQDTLEIWWRPWPPFPPWRRLCNQQRISTQRQRNDCTAFQSICGWGEEKTSKDFRKY